MITRNVFSFLKIIKYLNKRPIIIVRGINLNIETIVYKFALENWLLKYSSK